MLGTGTPSFISVAAINTLSKSNLVKVEFLFIVLNSSPMLWGSHSSRPWKPWVKSHHSQEQRETNACKLPHGSHMGDIHSQICCQLELQSWPLLTAGPQLLYVCWPRGNTSQKTSPQWGWFTNISWFLSPCWPALIDPAKQRFPVYRFQFKLYCTNDPDRALAPLWNFTSQAYMFSISHHF